jgi:dephospho-CoA kinase
MPILGITGGIAMGKTTFRQMLLERIPAEFFDADACAKALLNEDPAVRDAIIRQIHPQAYDASGVPDRRLLRELIYQNPELKDTLEAILHPVIRGRWLKEAETAKKAGRLFLVDIPLLFETKAEAFFDHLVVVACSLNKQISRLAGRGLSPEISEKIIASQIPIEIKIKGAHHVIWNDGLPERLMAQADLFSSYLHARYG